MAKQEAMVPGGGMLLAVMGPTASGKSELALELARRLDGEIVSADSMQLDRGLAIGTAQLVARVVSSLVNYFINREVVFKGDRRPVTIVKYYMLAVLVYLGTWGIIEALVRIGVSKLIAQPIANLLMFFFSYPMQKKFVFGSPKKG